MIDMLMPDEAGPAPLQSGPETPPELQSRLRSSGRGKQTDRHRAVRGPRSDVHKQNLTYKTEAGSTLYGFKMR